MWKDLPQETRRRELLETDQKNFCFPCKCVQCPPFELWEALPGTEAMNKGCKVSQGCLAKCLVLYGCAKCHTCKGGQAEERRRLQGAGGGTQIAAPEEGGGGKLARRRARRWTASSGSTGTSSRRRCTR